MVYKRVLEPKKIHSFSTVGFSGLKNFKYMCSGYLYCVYGQISFISWLFLWFLIYGLFQVLVLRLVGNF